MTRLSHTDFSRVKVKEMLLRAYALYMSKSVMLFVISDSRLEFRLRREVTMTIVALNAIKCTL